MKLSVFRPEDFEIIPGWTNIEACKDIARLANNRLNEWLKTEAKKVYGKVTPPDEPWDTLRGFHTLRDERSDTHQAYLIGIEPIECSHPKEKVRGQADYINSSKTIMGYFNYICDCGAKVQVKEFEEIK